MICPLCLQENDERASACFGCGRQFFADLKRGTLIGGRYELLDRLGGGGMGTVYRAHDRVLDDTVALKVLRTEIASSLDLKRRFRTEIKLARRVRHPNVCGIHEYGEEGDQHYISMELVDGIDLKELIRRDGPFPVEVAFDISIQLGMGLQAIHDAGIIHRDLKAANAMRDKQGVVRLMDFGIAKQLGSDSSTATLTGVILGTPEYMSPEQARSEILDARCDLYSLGIVIYEIFTGHVPFHGETPVATLFKQVQEPPPLDPERATGIPQALVPVIKKLLAKNPGDRQASVREVVEDLRRARDATLASQPAAARIAAPALGISSAPPPPSAGFDPRARMETPKPMQARLRAPAPTARPKQRPATRYFVVAALGAGLVAFTTGGALLVMQQLKPVGPTRPNVSTLVVATTTVVTTTTPPSTTTAPSRVVSVATPIESTPEPPRVATRESPMVRTTPRPAVAQTTIPKPLASAAPLAAQPTPAPPAGPSAPAVTTGTLQVIAHPWAEVSIDGKVVGTTPFAPVSLPVGAYTLIFNHPDYKPFQKKVTVRPEEVTRVEVNLAWEAFRR